MHPHRSCTYVQHEQQVSHQFDSISLTSAMSSASSSARQPRRVSVTLFDSIRHECIQHINKTTYIIYQCPLVACRGWAGCTCTVAYCIILLICINYHRVYFIPALPTFTIMWLQIISAHPPSNNPAFNSHQHTIVMNSSMFRSVNHHHPLYHSWK